MEKNPIEQFVYNLTGNKPDATLLLQYLGKIQRHYSNVPEQAVQTLATILKMPAVQIVAVIDFYTFLHQSRQGNFDILISDSITDHMLGSKQLLQQLCKHLQVTPGQPRDDGRVTVNTTSCTGLCDQGPAMLINGKTIAQLDAGRITKIAELVEADTPLAQWPKSFFPVKNNIRRSGPLLGKNLAEGDALRVFLKKEANAIINDLEASDLRGRGGAGFKVSSKWKICRDTQANEHFVVANADEGEPGTFKDRVLLQSYADELIEGMTLCAGIINARKGFIYLRAEYEYLLDHLENTLKQRRQQKLLGNNILGKQGFNFNIDIHLGAGAYICGQESALLESLEGRRGIPLNRPPFPVTRGYRGQPTVLNNVETFIAAAKIAYHGSQWFRSNGTEKSPGTKLLSISGDCAYPGIYEYPFGTTITEILKDCAAEHCQAIQISGAAGTTVPATEFTRQISFQDLSTGGSFMVFNEQRDLLDIVHNFSNFFVHESCGFCTPCRVGTSLLNTLVTKLRAGQATAYDLQEIRNITKTMRDNSHCGLGQTAPNAINDLLNKFPKSYQKHLKSKVSAPGFDLNDALSDARAINKAKHKTADAMEEKL